MDGAQDSMYEYGRLDLASWVVPQVLPLGRGQLASWVVPQVLPLGRALDSMYGYWAFVDVWFMRE